MTLNEIDFAKLLPGWMREDTANASLATSTSEVLKKMASSMAVLSKWTDEAIGVMSEEYLDLLAYELNVTWYLYDAPIDQKREIIKNARKIHWKLGTKWAIEQVLSIYFSSAHVLEWYEYTNVPHHFKVETAYPDLYVNDERLLKVLDSVKRYSQKLDTISITNEIRDAGHTVAAAESVQKNVIMEG